MLGTVALYFRQPRSPLGRDFELMGRLAALAAIAIERKRSEEALRHSEAQYRSLFENVIEGVYRSTVKGRFEAVNPALAHMLGYDTVEDLLAVSDMATLFTDSNERDHAILTLHREGVIREAECQLRRRDGTQVTVLRSLRNVSPARTATAKPPKPLPQRASDSRIRWSADPDGRYAVPDADDYR